MAIWRTEPVPPRKSMIGGMAGVFTRVMVEWLTGTCIDPLPPGWVKSTTDDGTPYYVRSVTNAT